MIGGDFFRSMSLVEDLGTPERFSHYRPTRRALPIIDSVVSPRTATMVIAPYGSGKSLAAGVGALVVRANDDDRRALEQVEHRLRVVDPTFAAKLSERVASGSRGAVIVLTGLVGDPLSAIAHALGMEHVPKTVDGFGKAMRDGGWDHVAIVWDEFGRHLEGLVAEGRSAELDLLQRLAERASRAEAPTMSLTLLLHQNLLAYASRLNESSRSEWRKIEGRFSALRMVEDSREFYRLIGEVVAGMRPPEAEAVTPPASVETARAVIDAKWLDGIDDEVDARAILDAARPLTAGALQILPTLVARVGQNERSLFSFLREMDLSAAVGIEGVYEAFSDAMRTDVGIGGTYRRWIETESARSRARDAVQREVLAAACLLQLGSSGERRRLPRSALELAVASPGTTPDEVRKAVDALIEARLLLWRRHNDDVAVWHGADIDVALRVREERARREVGFDLRTFLEERFPAPHVRAPGHNAEFGVNRFLTGRYVTLDELKAGVVPWGDQGGLIAYLLPSEKADLAAARKLAKDYETERVVIVVPNRLLEVESAAIELVSVEALRGDGDFIASDPMVVTEIDELQSVAFEQLATLMRGLLDPRAANARWFAEGRDLEVTADRPGSVAASRLLRRWFHSTPAIANEQLMRAAASRTMQTARVRVVGAIIERSERERLGYEEDDRSAEVSIYRTVLENTGLRPRGTTAFADAEALPDTGLRRVWSRIATFFGEATRDPGKPYKSLAQFIDGLAAAPTGVPRAVMPVLLAAGWKRFGRAVAIYKDGAYVPDLLGFAFDAMVTDPAPYTLHVLDLTPELRSYLTELCYTFTHERPDEHVELVGAVHDAIRRWLLTVPDGSRRSQKMSSQARAMLRVLTTPSDPIEMLVQGVPGAFGSRNVGADVLRRVEAARMVLISTES